MTYGTDGLAALGDATRRRIFERVATRPQCVGELARGLPVSRPAVSQHLAVLRAARLVSERKQGTRRIYSLDPRGIEAIRRYLDRFWDHALDRFKAAAEAAERDER